MLKDGRLERYKNGPIYWIDSADNNPCVGKQIHINITMIHNDLLICITLICILCYNTDEV